MKCSHCGSQINLHLHHVIYRSAGGADTQENLTPLCKDCHIAYHSAQDDYAKWGRKGGKQQVRYLTFLFTLAQYKNDPEKRIAYVRKNCPERLAEFMGN